MELSENGKADINQQNTQCGAPLHYLCLAKTKYISRHVCEYLIKAGADVNAEWNHKTPLHCLVLRYKQERTKPSDSKWRSNRNKPQSPSMIAMVLEIAQLLLDSGADINKKTDFGETPMHLGLSPLRLIL